MYISVSGTGLMKLILFTPVYALNNSAPFDIEVKEEGLTNWIKVPSKQVIPFWPKSKTKNMQVRVAGYEQESVLFNFESIRNTLLRLDNKVCDSFLIYIQM